MRRLRMKTDVQPPQSLTDPGMVDCDARLGAVLGEPRVPLASMEQRLAPLLAPAPPHVLHYTVRFALSAVRLCLLLSHQDRPCWSSGMRPVFSARDAAHAASHAASGRVSACMWRCVKAACAPSSLLPVHPPSVCCGTAQRAAV